MTRTLGRLVGGLLLALAAGVGVGVGLQLAVPWVPGRPAPPPAPPASPESMRQAFVPVAERVRPAVVSIATSHFLRRRRPPGARPLPGEPGARDFYERYFGQMPPAERERAGVGSGVVIDRDGHVLTNRHVIEGADEITVRLHTKKELRATVVGSDSRTDLAVLRIPAEGVVPAPLGDSDQLRVGEWAIAIGSPFGLEQTVTVGVISATGRSEMGIVPYEDFIQTDASINPGNSGGPLLNFRGEVIGINTAIVSAGQGIGFAIPINVARRVAGQLIVSGKVTRGWLGVALQPVTAELARALGARDARGAVVARVFTGGPAERAGLQPNDLIVRFGDVAVEDLAHLQRLVLDAPVGRPVTLGIVRHGQARSVTVTIGEAPADTGAPS